MTSPWTRVESTSITIRRRPWRSEVGGLHGHVDLLPGGLLGEHHPQPVGVGAGDVQVDGGDGVARHPLDAVDVGADVGDPAGDGGHGRGGERGAEDGHVGATGGAARVVAVALLDADLQVEIRRDLLDGRPQRLPVPGGGHEDPQDEPAAQHDLFDVEHLDAEAGDGGEDARGHTGTVDARQGDEQGPGCVTVHGPRLSVPGMLHGGDHRSSRGTVQRVECRATCVGLVGGDSATVVDERQLHDPAAAQCQRQHPDRPRPHPDGQVEVHRPSDGHQLVGDVRTPPGHLEGGEGVRGLRERGTQCGVGLGGVRNLPSAPPREGTATPPPPRREPGPGRGRRRAGGPPRRPRSPPR